MKALVITASIKRKKGERSLHPIVEETAGKPQIYLRMRMFYGLLASVASTF